MPTASAVDRLYRTILLSKFFIKGWGPPEHLMKLLQFRKRITSREDCAQLVPEDYPVHITKDVEQRDIRIIEGNFRSPFDLHLPELLPAPVKTCHFQMVLPRVAKEGPYKPLCIHMAGTGDHYFWRRRYFMAEPLLKEAGIGSIIVENPFYGLRKPGYQTRSELHNVLDIFVMGGCLIMEAIVLLRWCEKLNFFPLGVTGLSMGGHMASLVATNWPKPIVLVPCLSWSTASAVFTEGVMSKAIDWELLEAQYKDSLRSVRENINALEKAAYTAGQVLVKDCSDGQSPESQEDMRSILLNSNSSEGKRFKFLEAFDLFNSKSQTPMNWEREEALSFMRGIMDECTHLGNYPRPVDPEMIIAICAEIDGYVPRDGVADLTELWPDCEIRYLKCGHVSAVILYRHHFRKAIKDAFIRYWEKYGK